MNEDPERFGEESVRQKWIYSAVLAICAGITFWSLLGPLISGGTWRSCPQIYSDSDVALYLGMIKQESVREGEFDYYVQTDDSRVNLHHRCGFSVQFLGWILGHVGMNGLLLLLPLLWFIWIFALWRLAREFGAPPGPSLIFAFLLPGIMQISSAYLIGRNFGFIFSHLWEDYWRLYPTTFSETLYAVGLLGVIRVLKGCIQKPWMIALSGIGAGLPVYGRPFDWVVLMIFLGLAWLYLFFKKEKGRLVQLSWVMALGIVTATPYLLAYRSFMETNEDIFLVASGRQAIHYMSTSHYFRYTLFALLVMGSLLFVRWITRRCFSQYLDSRVFMLLLLLLSASLLGYYTTFPSRRTLVGMYYFLMDSISPWWCLAMWSLAWASLPPRRWMQQPLPWILLLFLLCSGSALWCHQKAARSQAYYFYDADPREFHECVEFLKKRESNPSQITLFTPTDGNLLITELGCHLYSTTASNQTSYVPNSELFRRYLVMMHLIRGDFGFIPRLMDSDGLPLSHLAKDFSVEDRKWYDLMKSVVGRFHLEFHPDKDSTMLEIRKIQLPVHLKNLNEEVVWLSSDLRDVFMAMKDEVSRAGWEKGIYGKHPPHYALLRTDLFPMKTLPHGWLLIHSSGPYRLYVIQQLGE